MWPALDFDTTWDFGPQSQTGRINRHLAGKPHLLVGQGGPSYFSCETEFKPVSQWLVS